jgi:hypothetical protein
MSSNIPVPAPLVEFLSQPWISESQTVSDQTTEPVIENSTEPVIENSTEPVIDQTTEPVSGQTTEPVIDQVDEAVEIKSVVDDSPDEISKEDMDLIEQLSNENSLEAYGSGGGAVADAAMEQNINFLMELFFMSDALMLPMSFINPQLQETSFVGSCVATKIYTYFTQFREKFENMETIESFYGQIYQAGCSDYKRLCGQTNRRLAFEESLRFRRAEAIVYVTNQLVTNQVNQNNMKRILGAVKNDNTALVINRDNTTFVAIYRQTVPNTWIIVDPTCPYVGVLNDDSLFSLITMESLWDYGITILTTKSENVETIIPSVRIVSPSNPDGNLRILPGEPYNQIAM